MQELRLLLVMLRATVVVSIRRLLRGAVLPAWRLRMEAISHALKGEARKAIHLPVDRLRARMPPSRIPRRIAKQVVLEPGTVGGIPAETTRPHGWTPSDPTVMYMHGGGYALCSPGTHRELVARIAVAARARCVSIDYRLAPEHPCPAAVDDGVAAYHALLDAGTPADSIVFAGDSAGGGLAVATLLRLVATGSPLPRAGVLLSPWVDMECAGESIDGNAPYCYLQRPGIERFARYYLQGRSPQDPVASPVHADLSGLPPLLVQTGSVEALYSECVLFAERARAAGVDVTLQIGEGMFHVWHAFASIVSEARPVIEDIGRFVRARVAETSKLRGALLAETSRLPSWPRPHDSR
jgi:monoterpene epsilon-lactone hydrolase